MTASFHEHNTPFPSTHKSRFAKFYLKYIFYFFWLGTAESCHRSDHEICSHLIRRPAPCLWAISLVGVIMQNKNCRELTGKSFHVTLQTNKQNRVTHLQLSPNANIQSTLLKKYANPKGKIAFRKSWFGDDCSLLLYMYGYGAMQHVPSLSTHPISIPVYNCFNVILMAQGYPHPPPQPPPLQTSPGSGTGNPFRMIN